VNLDTFDIKRARFSLNTVGFWLPESRDKLKATAFAKVDELIALSTCRESPGFTMMSRVSTQFGYRFFALVVYADGDGQEFIEYNEFRDTDAAMRFAHDLVMQHNGTPILLTNPEGN